MKSASNSFALAMEAIEDGHSLLGGNSHQFNPPSFNSLGCLLSNSHTAICACTYNKRLHSGVQDVVNVLGVEGVPFPAPPIANYLIVNDLEIIAVTFSQDSHATKTVGLNHIFPLI
jgi:hypothetical protein